MFKHLKDFFAQKDSVVVGLIFFLNSFLFGNWITRIPDVKTSLSINDAELGFALLGAPIASIIIMPFAGWIIERFKLGNITFWSSLFHFLSLIYLANVPDYPSLIFALGLFGGSNALMDISMNAAAIEVQNRLQKPIISTCHGMWSFGGMIGAGVASVFLGFSIHTEFASCYSGTFSLY